MHCIRVKCLSMLTAVLDDLHSFTSAEMDVDSFIASSTIPGADLSWLETDPDISDPELDQESPFSEAGPSLLEQDSESDEDSDLDPSEIHPCLKPPSKGCPNISEPGSLHMRDLDGADPDEDTNATYAANLPDIVPDIVARLWRQLLAGYTHPIYPPINDSIGGTLTASEELSLKHYMAWVDSRGTVKAYSLHAEVLQKATDC